MNNKCRNRQMQKAAKLQQAQPKILVSACLIGECVRYKGDSCPQNLLLSPKVRKKILPFCPECAGGLSTPRPPAEIRGEGGGAAVWRHKAQVINNQGKDVTQAYQRGAKLCLKVMQKYQLNIAILKQRSPSCGTEEIYDGSFSVTKISGQGVTAALLTRHGITLYSEEELSPALLATLLA